MGSAGDGVRIQAPSALVGFDGLLQQPAKAARLNQAREQANARLAEARKGIEQDVEVAKAGLQTEADRLANDVIATVLRPAATAGGAR